ncbi:complement factor H isoform 2-T2 [Polymixia lowei]
MQFLLDTGEWRKVMCLLLLCLLVVRGAADCPIPQTTGNLALTDGALLKNEFPEGIRIEYECAHGYVKENGTGVATCLGGQWTAPDLNCTKKDCGPPREQPHMAFDYSEGTLFGATIRAFCDKGYLLLGTAYKQCYARGWSGRAKCEIVSCDEPRDIDNGRHSWVSQANPTYGKTIQYFCLDDYTLKGNSSIVCGENGLYDSEPPKCEGGKDSLTTVDNIATTTVTPSTPPPVKGITTTLTTRYNLLLTETTTTADTSSTPTPQRDTVTPTSELPSTSAVAPSVQVDGDISTTGDGTTTARATAAPPATRGKRLDVDINKGVGYTIVTLAVVSTVIVVLMVVVLIYILVKRKGDRSPNGTVIY